ncbi:MAG: hypothetical protein LBV63_04995 [Candidatus Methanoplasma sp.]|jgi:hypothetical protein|nr:hypothetical protein [Candidatus Methanoplasma sp.]
MGESALRSGLAKVFGRGSNVYDAKTAFFFCLALSAVLWWIPSLGAAVAGYVCGRKAGSMTMGLVCSFLSGSLILILVWLLAPYFGTEGAIGAYFATFDNGSGLDLSNLGLVAVFGLVGGILSRQVRKETAYLLSTGATEFAVRPAARSMALYSRDKDMGFECFDDCISRQEMAVNTNSGSVIRPSKETMDKAPPQERRQPVTTTVQTVTTSASESTTTSPDAPGKGPFSDILDRSGGKGHGKG